MEQFNTAHSIGLDCNIESEAMSVRASNVCINAQLNTPRKLINYFLQHGTFLELKNCGNNTGEELKKIIKKYKIQSQPGDLDYNIFVENEFLSVRTINLCKKENIDTALKLFNYYIQKGSFSLLIKHDYTIEQEFRKIFEKYRIKFKMDQNLNVIQVKPFERYSDYPLNYLKSFIKGKMFKILIDFGISTIGQLYNLSPIDLITKNKGSAYFHKRLKQIKHFLHNNPQRVIEAIEKINKKETLLPTITFRQETVHTIDFLTAFNQILLSFLELNNNNKEKNILLRRFEIGYDKKYNTLEFIGIFNDISKERTRNILNRSIDKLRVLLNGGMINKPFCKCNDIYVNKISNAYKILLKNSIISQKKALKLLGEETNTNFTDENMKFFKLLLVLWQIEEIAFKEEIFLNIKNIDSKLFTNICVSIIDVLLECAIAVDFIELANTVKKHLKNDNIDNELILNACINLENVEKLNNDMFQIHFISLSSVGDKAYRILFANQYPMDYKSIWKEINNLMIKYNFDHKGSATTLGSRLAMDKRFTAIGKSGYWALSEWNVSNETLKTLVHNFISASNSPCNIIEITNYIRKNRTNVKEKSIYSILHYYKDIFSRTRDDKYILKEWENRYKTATIGKRSKQVPEKRLYDILKKIFSDNNNQKLSVEQLRTLLTKNGIKFNYSTLYTRMNKCNALKKIGENGKNYYYFDFKTPFSSMTIKKQKKQTLKNLFIKILINLQKKIRLTELIKIAQKNGFNKILSYKVISENKEFKKTLTKKHRVYVSLNRKLKSFNS